MPTDGADLAAIREKHKPRKPFEKSTNEAHRSIEVCAGCSDDGGYVDWPCDTAIALQEASRLGEALEAARNGLQEIREMASRHDPKKNWAFPAAMPIEAIAHAALKASE